MRYFYFLLFYSISFSAFSQTVSNYKYQGSINLSSFDKDKWYPVAFGNDNPNFNLNKKIVIKRDNVHDNFTWAGSCYFDLMAQAYAWGHNLGEYEYTNFYNGDGLIAAFANGGAFPVNIVWLRGGRTYSYLSNVEIANNTTLGQVVTYTSGGSTYTYPVYNSLAEIPDAITATGFPNSSIVKPKLGHYNKSLGYGIHSGTNGLHFDGNNKWAINNPTDGRKDLLFAPMGVDGYYDYSKSIKFTGNGGIEASSNINTTGNINITGSMYATGNINSENISLNYGGSNVGLKIASGGGSPYSSFFRFGDNTGWKMIFGKRRNSPSAAENTGEAGAVMTLVDMGNIGIGTTNPLQRLDVSGSVRANNNFVAKGTLLGYDGIGAFLSLESYGGRLECYDYSTATWKNMTISPNGGNVGIGTSSPRTKLDINGNVAIGMPTNTAYPNNYKLAIGGNALAEKMVVKLQTNWPDYVFQSNYKLSPLKQVEEHIKANGHLPNIPSEKDVKENGIDLGDMNAKLLQKIEELTLYIIAQQKTIEKQEERIKKLEKKASF